MSYVGEKLAQHSGLALSRGLDAEHDKQLIVEPVVECREDKDEVWGEFGCEIFDRKLAHMVGELRAGHKFKKLEWGRSDSAEPKYEHELLEKEKKRKKRPGQNKEEEEVGSALKDTRLSISRKDNSEGEG
ncbi:Uncharacterized protein Rs2_38509 [Raphanus sativus]|nr:Uncharacterized protein Rs2_38509 [Raphanus sativus]